LAEGEDYGGLADGLVTRAEVDDVAWLVDAREVADQLIAHFADVDGGGFYVTGDDAETLIVRPKDLFDDATPSANSLAANALLRLATLTGDGYETVAIAAIRAIGPVAAAHPTAFGAMLLALERHVTAPIEVAIVGPPGDAATDALRREVFSRLLPVSVVLSAPAGQGTDVSPLLEGREAIDGRATAFVCEHYACRVPVDDPVAL